MCLKISSRSGSRCLQAESKPILLLNKNVIDSFGVQQRKQTIKRDVLVKRTVNVRHRPNRLGSIHKKKNLFRYAQPAQSVQVKRLWTWQRKVSSLLQISCEINSCYNQR